MTFLRILLFPFAILFNLITRVRNYFYDRGLKPVASFSIPIICIGNLSTGGTGKTPMIEHLIRLLAHRHKLATLSRGYKRKTAGFRIAQAGDNAETLGDEPSQFYNKYGDQITVAVGEDRALAIPSILQEFPETEVVLLDDAFQHRRVKPSLSIVLTQYSKPFYADFLLPTGNLRESRDGVNRADVVVVTKCPTSITDDNIMKIEKAIHRYACKPVFFTTIHYGNPLPYDGRKKIDESIDKVIVVTGIANSAPFITYVKQHYTVVHHLEFPDHHCYTAADIQRMKEALMQAPDAVILTTEKDKANLEAPTIGTLTNALPLFFIPIEVQFIRNGVDFDELVLSHVNRVL